MESTLLVLLAGDDRLTEHVCAELTATTGHHVRVVWPLSPERQATFVKLGASVTPLSPTDDNALVEAGVMTAASILTLSSDDSLNLSVALRARALNPKIRIVLRQFDTMLGRKLEQNLPNCTVLSRAAQAASTYAGAALDPSCFFAIRFPEGTGPLVGFTANAAEDLGIEKMTVGEAERRLRCRIVAIGTHEDPEEDTPIAPRDYVTVFGRIAQRRNDRSAEAESAHFSEGARVRALPTFRDLADAYRRTNPILRVLVGSAVVFFALSFVFFHFELGRSWTASVFSVVETMTNVDAGEAGAVTHGPLVTLAAIVTMFGGIVFTSIFIGYVSSAVTRAQWIALQGLRRIRARDHIVMCGAGQVGSAVLNLLTAAGKRVVIVEPNPRADLLRKAREPNVDLLTGDARGDGALEMCDIEHATAFLALTDSDAINLEIALSARARSPGIHIVVRMEDSHFARAAKQVLGISTFSPTALTAPAFAGLARFPGTRGRVRYGGDDHTIGQRQQNATPERPPARICTPLCVWRRNEFQLLRRFEDMQPYDLVCFSVPLAQFRA